LFFDLHHGNLIARPMKGTAPRGKWHAHDEEIRENLKKGRKERAENLMIVDLLRNDMGKVAVTGSVKVPSLFDVETLDTVHQMTSTISARVKQEVGIVELFRAMFPCGSITGAPKRRSMEIIAETENSPRGIYTGCIGYISPKGEAVFSVAIRTIVIDAASGTGELGTGGGITWDSTAASEYEECLVKSRFAQEVRPDFQLVETLLYQEDEGYFLLERHMARLYRSSNYFGFTLRLGAVLDILNLRAQPLQGKHKVRLLLSRNGTFSVQTEQLPAAPEEQMAIVTLADRPVDSHNPFLYHKTTNRLMYEQEQGKHPHCTDVIFCNEQGEITEASRHNIVVNMNGRMLTPPLSAGLLPGTFREELLASQVVREKRITVQDLRQADDIFLVNSVRKWRKAQLV
jgi:para-aminobenzoate synthetase/4-amino-4-deoxychorismate lyase